MATKEQEQTAERVQMTFLRGTLGLHANGSGAADEVIRAETGCERLRDRWTKLKLGYWRRLFVAPETRLLRKVAEFRWQERITSGGVGYGSIGWMATAETSLSAMGLDAFWRAPSNAADMELADWRSLTYEAVNAASDTARATRMTNMTSASTYMVVKEWGINTEQYSASTGEIGRLGQHVPERYLDDRTDLKGTRLKLLCRLGCLPIMDRVGREVHPKWAKETRTCFACNGGSVEDVRHFIMDCPSYSAQRGRMFEDVRRSMERSLGPGDGNNFDDMGSTGQYHVILGKRIGDPSVEDRIDRTVKTYLRKAWNTRSIITTSINNVLGTNYDVFKRDSSTI